MSKIQIVQPKKIADWISFDIDVNIYADFPKLKKELEIISKELTKLYAINNYDAKIGMKGLSTLKDNGYIDFVDRKGITYVYFKN